MWQIDWRLCIRFIFNEWRDTVVCICGSIVATYRYLNEMFLDGTLFGTIGHTIYSHKSKVIVVLEKTGLLPI